MTIDPLRSAVDRVAVGPTLSRALSRSEACAAMLAGLREDADPVTLAAFLVALRVKGETDDELLGVMDAVRARAVRAPVDVDELVVVADVYDGYRRSPCLTPFLPPVLAACGVPTVLEGTSGLGPRIGVSAAQVLAAAGHVVDDPPAVAARRLATAGLGWAYLDQDRACPELARLLPLRNALVKRSALHAVERYAGALVAPRVHLVTGFVHGRFGELYGQLGEAAGFASSLVVRGLEGGPILSGDRQLRWVAWRDGAPRHGQEIPATGGAIEGADEVGVGEPVGREVGDALAAGTAALDGERGPAFRSVSLSAGLALAHVGRVHGLAEGVAMARGVLLDGSAARRWREAAPRGA